jgi:hypothetical protein
MSLPAHTIQNVDDVSYLLNLVLDVIAAYTTP